MRLLVARTESVLLQAERGQAEARMSAIAALEDAGATAPDAPALPSAAPIVQGTSPVHPHIAALDGLRFFAAFSVMVGHGYWYVVLLQQDPAAPNAFDNLMLSGAGIGMTLFFVLSGFVIHHKTVPASASGKLDFFIARFARLYPLFLLVFGYDFYTLLWSQGYFSGYVFSSYDVFKALPFYLTFTQTWWWWPIGSTTAYGYYSTWLTGATGAMWSLSTEAFFYFAYLFGAGLLGRLVGRRLAVAGVAVLAYGLFFYIFGWLHSNTWSAWAATHFPEVDPNELTHWILFQSPYGRISEFLLGAIAAQVYLTRAGKDKGELTGHVLTYGSLGIFLALVVAIFAPPRNPYGAIGTQCCAVFVATLIYAAARYRSLLSRFLSSPLLVKLGNASYSLYLLHYFVLHDYGQLLVVRHPDVSRWAIYIGMMIVALAVSYVSYMVIERPALRWVRANFRPLRMTVWLPVTLALITLFSVLISIQMRALAHSETIQPPGRIAVSSASFGENCDAKLHDNILGLMRRVCNGETACSFDYDVAKIRDPAGGCLKRFQVLYACGPGDAQREYLLQFSRPQMQIQLACK
jgi:peptidoglycan/LPS O-acetylase OafA/YrhL